MQNISLSLRQQEIIGLHEAKVASQQKEAAVCVHVFMCLCVTVGSAWKYLTEAQKEASVRVVLVRILLASGKEGNSESGWVGILCRSNFCLHLSFGELCIQRRRGVLDLFFPWGVGEGSDEVHA